MIYTYWFQWMWNDWRKYCHVRVIQSNLIKIQLMMPKHVLKSLRKTSICLYLYINIVHFCWKFVQRWWRLKRTKPVFNALHWSHNKIKISRWFDVLASSVIECQLMHDTCTMQSQSCRSNLANAILQMPRSCLLKFWLALTRDQIALECQRTYRRIRKQQPIFQGMLRVHVTWLWRDLWGKSCFLRCQKFSGFYSVEQKPNTL